MKSLKGFVLVADRELLDPNFVKSVVLLVEHTEDGALGLILNRPTKVTLKQLWSQVSQDASDSPKMVHQGGPCNGPLMVLHGRAGLSENQVIDGVLFTADSSEIEQLVRDNESQAKFFVGYAGWGAGQLEGELRAGGWLTAPATAEIVYEPVHDLWKKVARKIAGESFVTGLGIKHAPDDPRVN